MRLAIMCLGLAVMPLVSASAQTGSAESVKAAVQAFVRSYTEAANRADVSSYVGMYKESPDLITISSGEVNRGWSSVRDEANAMLGTEGAFKISTGVVDVLPLGPTRAVAAFPFVVTLNTQAGVQQLKGACTLVLEKTGSRWLIVHDHTSYQSQ